MEEEPAAPSLAGAKPPKPIVVPMVFRLVEVWAAAAILGDATVAISGMTRAVAFDGDFLRDS